MTTIKTIRTIVAGAFVAGALFAAIPGGAAHAEETTRSFSPGNSMAWDNLKNGQFEGSVDGDGDSDGRDFLTWQRHYGSSTSADRDGKDFVDGEQDNGAARMGAGDDVFQWDPGDGAD